MPIVGRLKHLIAFWDVLISKSLLVEFRIVLVLVGSKVTRAIVFRHIIARHKTLTSMIHLRAHVDLLGRRSIPILDGDHVSSSLKSRASVLYAAPGAAFFS